MKEGRMGNNETRRAKEGRELEGRVEKECRER